MIESTVKGGARMVLSSFSDAGAIGIIIYSIIVLAVLVPVVWGILKLYKLVVRALKKYVGDDK